MLCFRCTTERFDVETRFEMITTGLEPSACMRSRCSVIAHIPYAAYYIPLIYFLSVYQLIPLTSSPHPLSPASSLQASIPPCSLSFLPSHYLISLDTNGLLQGAHPGYPPPRRELQGQEVGVGWLIHLRSPNIQERLKENLRGGPRSGRVHPCWKRALPHRDKPSPHLPPPPGGAGMQLQEGRIFVPWRFPGPGTASA